MATIQDNMVDRSLPVADKRKKLKSNPDIPNLNFKLHLDIYRPQMPPSESPPSHSDDADEHLMPLEMRDEEAPVTSRNRNTSGDSSSSSRSVDENLPKLPSNVVDNGNDMEVDHAVQPTIYECAICNFATKYQKKLADHQRTVHCFNGRRDSDSSSHDPTENAALEGGYNHILDPSYLNSSQDNSSFVKEEATGMEDDDSEALPADGVSTALVNTASTCDGSLGETKTQKKQTREEVNPLKYFEVFNGEVTKYGCAECGSLYKYRKTLNKHWKEKHNMAQLLETDKPPGLLHFMKTGTHSNVKARILYANAFLRKIQAPTQSDTASDAANSSINLVSDLRGMLIIPASVPTAHDISPSNVHLLANLTDPLAADQAAFPVMPMGFSQYPVHINDYNSPDEGVLDLSCHRNHNSGNSTIAGTRRQDREFSLDQDQALDFTSGNNFSEKVAPKMLRNNLRSSTRHSVRKLPSCLKYDSPGTPETESAAYTNSHTPKSVVTCEECKLQMQSMDVLNNHFMKHHIQKLLDYKEAIRKIPHGLQQTYHLLNMGIREIVELGHQDLGSPDGISLKCKKCDFETQQPADFQKHAVSHTEERPYACMVCGATYKFKWDLVKHFERSHASLPNPYRKNDRKDAGNDDSEEDDDEPPAKTAKLDQSDFNNSLCHKSGTVSVEGITEGEAMVSGQQNYLDPVITKNQTVLGMYLNSDADEKHMNIKQDMDRTAQKNDKFHETQTARTQQCMSPNDRHVKNSCKKNRTKGKRTLGEGSDSFEESTPGKHPWKCPHCEFYCGSPTEMMQHMKTHSEEKRYKCSSCDYRSTWKSDVGKHNNRCNGGKSFVIDTNPKKPQASVNSGPQNAIGNKKGKGKRKAALSFSGTLQATDEDASFLSFTEAKDDFPQADAKALPKRKRSNKLNNSNNHTAIVNNSHSAEIDGGQLASLKQAPPTTSRGDTSPSGTTPSLPHSKSSSHISSVAAWRCSHCDFTTCNQVEFKRHSHILHSDDKPFKCEQCNYDSSWSGDLKKHRHRYNHFPKTNCSKDISETHKESQWRFDCSHCLMYFGTLQELADHCLAEHYVEGSSQNSALTVMENTIDLARIKHPRKRQLLHRCSGCPFVCVSYQALETHILESIHCHYCKSAFQNKESLFDHIITHEEFIPKEWELYFITETQQYQAKSGKKRLQRADNNKLGKHKSSTMEICQDGYLFNGENLAGRDTKVGTSSQISPHIKNTAVGEINFHPTDKYTQECASTMHDAMNETVGDKKTCNFSRAGSGPQVQLYESKQTMQCCFCNVSVEDLNHLYKHLITSHGPERNKPILNPLSNIKNHNYSSASSSTKTWPGCDSSHSSSQDAMDVCSKNEVISSKMARNITWIARQQYMWNDAPVNVVVVGCTLKFACSLCDFSNASNSETDQHFTQNHKAITRFRCKTCHFSHDNEDIMSDHCEAEHQPSERVVEVLVFKQIDHSDLRMFLIALKESLTCEIGQDTKASPCNKSAILATLVCQLCPFSTNSKEMMKGHVENHTNQAEYQCDKCNFSRDSAADITDQGKVHEAGYTSAADITEHGKVHEAGYTSAADITEHGKVHEAGYTSAADITEHGKVHEAGYTSAADITEHGKVHEAGYTSAADITDQGKVHEAGYTSAADITEHGKVHEAGYTSAADITEHGKVHEAGYTSAPDITEHGKVHEAGYTSAADITEHGKVHEAGYTSAADFTEHGKVHEAGYTSAADITEQGKVHEAGYTSAADITEHGKVHEAGFTSDTSLITPSQGQTVPIHQLILG